MLHPLELHTYRALRAAAAPRCGPPDAAHPAPSRLALVLCLSGGRDSTALLHALLAVRSSPLAARLPALDLRAIHFNHQRRGEDSDADEAFVRDLCLQHGVGHRAERLSETGPAHPGNFQNAARRWRHARAQVFLDEILSSCKEDMVCGWVLMAHHARDHAETVLLHLARGTGLEGLQGLATLEPARRIMRPWSDVPFDEIVKYVASRRIAFREDASNAETDYRRNLIRHRLLPVLAELNPSYERALRRLSLNARECLAETTDPTVITPSSVRALARTHGPELLQVLTRNSIENIVHHAHLHLQNDRRTYRVPLGTGWAAVLENRAIRFERSSTGDLGSGPS